MSDSLSNPQSEIRNPKSPLTDSPWLWVLLFSLMGLITLAVFGHKYDRRQANIERNYQARSRVAERLTAENNPQAVPRIDDVEAQRPYATPGNKLIPLWPLGLLLGIVSVVAAEMLRRTVRGRGSPQISR
jgi:hypothetical protein